jgi:hypothetical protein
VRNALALPSVMLGWTVGLMPPGTSPPHGVNRLQADDSCNVREAIFDRDPQHLWNRLHHLFYSRITHDGKVYDQESLEPLFVPQSKFLTEAPFYPQAVALLEKFLKDQGHEQIKDPLKRAILQRDLWAIFSTKVSDANGTSLRRNLLLPNDLRSLFRGRAKKYADMCDTIFGCGIRLVRTG